MTSTARPNSSASKSTEYGWKRAAATTSTPGSPPGLSTPSASPPQPLQLKSGACSKGLTLSPRSPAQSEQGHRCAGPPSLWAHHSPRAQSPADVAQWSPPRPREQRVEPFWEPDQTPTRTPADLDGGSTVTDTCRGRPQRPSDDWSRPTDQTVREVPRSPTCPLPLSRHDAQLRRAPSGPHARVSSGHSRRAEARSLRSVGSPARAGSVLPS